MCCWLSFRIHSTNHRWLGAVSSSMLGQICFESIYRATNSDTDLTRRSPRSAAVRVCFDDVLDNAQTWKIFFSFSRAPARQRIQRQNMRIFGEAWGEVCPRAAAEINGRIVFLRPESSARCENRTFFSKRTAMHRTLDHHSQRRFNFRSVLLERGWQRRIRNSTSYRKCEKTVDDWRCLVYRTDSGRDKTDFGQKDEAEDAFQVGESWRVQIVRSCWFWWIIQVAFIILSVHRAKNNLCLFLIFHLLNELIISNN